MKITLSEIYKAIKEQVDYVNLNNSIRSLEYAKGIIEFKDDKCIPTEDEK